MANEAKQFTIGGVTHDVMDVGARQLITQLQAAINAVQTALNNLMNGASVTDAIDTFNEVKAFLDGIDTSDPTLANQLLALNNAISALQTALAGKISGIKANGASETLPVVNGIVELPPAGSTISPATNAPQMDGTAAVGSSDKYAREDHVHPHDTSKLSKSDVSVETQGDGTVDINVADDKYTINLNHTHENMAKLIVCEESDLPSTLDPATIYAITDSGETEIEKLIIKGMEFAGGGGTPSTEPKIVSPIGTQIDFNSESTKTITVRATNLSESLTIAVTGVTANLQTISASDAENGVQLTLTKGQNFNGGTLRIYNSEVDKSWTVIDSQAYHPIAAVKLTGTQWLQTDYVPGPDTEFSMKCKFTENSNTNQSGYSYKYCYLLCCPYDGNKRFSFYNGHAGDNPTDIFGQIEDNTTTPRVEIGSDITLDNSFLNLVKGTSGCTLTFLAGGTTQYNLSLPIKSTSMSQPMAIGYLFSQSAIYGVYDLTIYELIISENGVERRHYVPKTFNGVPGLYDTVTNTFISSETNDELVAIPLT